MLSTFTKTLIHEGAFARKFHIDATNLVWHGNNSLSLKKRDFLGEKQTILLKTDEAVR
ncbi:hypothetical protein [Floridanema evergladense]|uniref:Transposase n=1 Tax=Floridaenema evergladense BLCC-F167 TaxID=3153639 RepID=A0ABV4WSS1_9CYAN